jgi:hypothetical protein
VLATPSVDWALNPETTLFLLDTADDKAIIAPIRFLLFKL